MLGRFELLDEVELYDLNARYYDPSIARFLTEDPYYNLGNRVMGVYEINVPNVYSIMLANVLYTYCGNNPLGFVDSSGKDPIPKWALNIKSYNGTDSDYEKALEIDKKGTVNAWGGFAYYTVSYAIEMAKKESTAFKYNWTGEHVTKAFKSKVISISEKLNVSPDDLMAVMAFESTLDPNIQNSSGFVGLIQFGEMAAQEVGTTREELLNMTAVEQMDYVYKFLSEKLKNIENPTLSDLYMAVLAPARVGLPGNATVYSAAEHPNQYNANKPLDLNDDEVISIDEATSFVIDRRESYGLLEE